MNRGQPTLLTLKNGHPGAFNNPCAGNTGEEGNDTSYHSLKHTTLTLFELQPLSCHRGY